MPVRTRRAAGGPSARRSGPVVLLLALALLLTGCGWFGGDDEPSAIEATPAPVAQAEPDVEVIGAEDVEVGEPQQADAPGRGLYYVSSLYDVSGPALGQPVLVRMVLDSAVPDGTPLAVASRADADARWTFLEARLDSDRRHVEFIASELGTFGVLAVDTGSVADTLTRKVAAVLARGEEAPEGGVAPQCSGASAAREAGYRARASAGATVEWCLETQGETAVLRVTNNRGVPVRLTAPDAVDRGETGEAAGTRAPWPAWIDAVTGEGLPAGADASGSGPDTMLAPGRTLTLGVTLEPGARQVVTATDDARNRSVRLLDASIRALGVQVEAFGVVPDGAVPRPARLLERSLAQPACAAAVAKDVRALLRRCLSETSLTKAYGTVALLLRPAVVDDAVRRMLRDQLAELESDAPLVEQRIRVGRARPDFSPLVGSYAGTDRSLVVAADGTVTETWRRDGRRVAELAYQLSDPVEEGARATATVTAVEVLAPRLLPGPAPRVGQSGTISVVRGVVASPFLRADYCNAERAAQGRCTDPEPEPEPTAESEAEQKSGAKPKRERAEGTDPAVRDE